MSHSTTTAEKHTESIDQGIAEFAFWTQDGDTPRYWGTHHQCEWCQEISSLGPEDIRHAANCPNGDED
jgi:hypothetical protein